MADKIVACKFCDIVVTCTYLEASLIPSIVRLFPLVKLVDMNQVTGPV